MTKKQEITIHFGFWIFFIVMNLYSDLISEKDFFYLWGVLQLMAFYTLHIIIFYLNYWWICEKTVPKKKWWLFILGQIFLIFFFPALRHLFEEVIIFRITGQHNYNENSLLTPYYVYDNSYYAIRIILFSLVFYFVKTIWNTNQKMNELLLQKKQAELQNLKNQLSPHFLFNTLNSFYADLMDIHPKTAEDLLKLSDMLRYITYESESNNVYLKDEILFIQNYIALFSRRFDNQLAVTFEVNSDNDKAQIPSLLLIHFVENAFKHGIISDIKKPVKIELKTTANKLYFSVENYITNSESYDEKGIGYKNIRQRLEILFSGNYVLNVNKIQEFYQVKLQIPL
ncbi:sensor histidine kinase [Empedobacter brevis]|uniref:sensor histidine kinase n=1 Tax=Empedobacter brevis TaxID=247 RepID=UPI00289E9CDC|nr:histidine kinase [Empedobacter brevis]